MLSPFRDLVIDRILPVVSPMSVRILLSSVFNCTVSRCESFEFLMPPKANCLAFIPSLAATLGFACAGGLTSIEAYVFTGGVGWLLGMWV